jgi:hypothetical protein
MYQAQVITRLRIPGTSICLSRQDVYHRPFSEFSEMPQPQTWSYLEMYTSRTVLLIGSIVIQTHAASLPIWIMVSSITKAITVFLT